MKNSFYKLQMIEGNDIHSEIFCNLKGLKIELCRKLQNMKAIYKKPTATFSVINVKFDEILGVTTIAQKANGSCKYYRCKTIDLQHTQFNEIERLIEEAIPEEEKTK